MKTYFNSKNSDNIFHDDLLEEPDNFFDKDTDNNNESIFFEVDNEKIDHIDSNEARTHNNYIDYYKILHNTHDIDSYINSNSSFQHASEKYIDMRKIDSNKSFDNALNTIILCQKDIDNINDFIVKNDYVGNIAKVMLGQLHLVTTEYKQEAKIQHLQSLDKHNPEIKFSVYNAIKDNVEEKKSIILSLRDKIEDKDLSDKDKENFIVVLDNCYEQLEDDVEKLDYISRAYPSVKDRQT